MMKATPRRISCSASARVAAIDAQEPHAADSCWLSSRRTTRRALSAAASASLRLLHHVLNARTSEPRSRRTTTTAINRRHTAILCQYCTANTVEALRMRTAARSSRTAATVCAAAIDAHDDHAAHSCWLSSRANACRTVPMLTELRNHSSHCATAAASPRSVMRANAMHSSRVICVLAALKLDHDRHARPSSTVAHCCTPSDSRAAPDARDDHCDHAAAR